MKVLAINGSALTALDAMYHFFMLQNMFVVGSTYWAMAYGQMPGAAILTEIVCKNEEE
jgi:multimeric flavodoxin WrbA